MPEYEIAAQARVARTFQNIRLFGGMTVLENLMVAQHNKLMVASGYSIGGILGLPCYQRRPERGAARRRSTGWSRSTSSTAPTIRRPTCPTAPSGGWRSPAPCAPIRCCSASTSRPPASTRANRPSSTNLLRFIRDEQSSPILLIEHDMGVVMEISDHIVVLDYGEKISDGGPDFVRNDPRVIAAYLGVDDEEVESVEEEVAV